MSYESRILGLTRGLENIPRSDTRAQMLYRGIIRVAQMSKAPLPQGVELCDLVYVYQHLMEEFDKLKSFDDLSPLEAAAVKAVEVEKFDNLTFRHH